MSRKAYSTFALICLIVILSNFAVAQSVADSTNQSKPVYANVEANFYKAIGPQSRLYNGIEYSFYSRNITGNAYFMDNADWSKGSVMYDGYLYKNINLLYDIYKDVIVTQLYNSALTIMLVKDKVESFNLLNHHFIHIEENPANNSGVKEGFYDELYAGKIKVLVYRSKNIQTNSGTSGSIGSANVQTYFTPSTNYYIYKNGVYYSVGSKKSFLNVLKDQKKQLQQYISDNGIDYSGGKEMAMVKIAAYYDHLTN